MLNLSQFGSVVSSGKGLGTKTSIVFSIYSTCRSLINLMRLGLRIISLKKLKRLSTVLSSRLSGEK